MLVDSTSNLMHTHTHIHICYSYLTSYFDRAVFSESVFFFLVFEIVLGLLQVLGYGWAGLLRKYVVEPAHMWWPSTLVQVSLFR